MSTGLKKFFPAIYPPLKELGRRDRAVLFYSGHVTRVDIYGPLPLYLSFFPSRCLLSLKKDIEKFSLTQNIRHGGGRCLSTAVDKTTI
jgi:hypothetical protein